MTILAPARQHQPDSNTVKGHQTYQGNQKELQNLRSKQYVKYQIINIKYYIYTIYILWYRYREYVHIFSARLYILRGLCDWPNINHCNFAVSDSFSSHISHHLLETHQPSTPQAAPFQASLIHRPWWCSQCRSNWHSDVDNRQLQGSPLGDLDGTQGHHGT